MEILIKNNKSKSKTFNRKYLRQNITLKKILLILIKKNNLNNNNNN